jgi:PhzF family phenazine biosynthesis protein
MDLDFRLLNVFAIDDDPFSGNQLCVFEDAAGLSDSQMQAWARQFNLSETTFVTARRPDEQGADVRIFTASYEMPFAGHPTLGTAHVVAGLAGECDEVWLSMPAGRIPVRRMDDGWQLQVNPATARPLELPARVVGEALGVPAAAVVEGASSFVDAGVEQLLIQLSEADALRACEPDARSMGQHLSVAGHPPQVYVWAWTGESTVEARFFAASGSTVEEDPATGSAASNFGSWLALDGRRREHITISQGDHVARPSRLLVTIDGAGTVFVAGRVTEVGRGSVQAAAPTRQVG